MQKAAQFRLLLTGCLLGLVTTVAAQEPASTTDAQADVWATVEAQWNSAAKGNGKWIDEYLADDFVGWGKESPAPRGKSSTRLWDRFESSQGKELAHELYPLSIVVYGDVAVAHYLYSSAYEGKDGDVDVSNGRYTDVLVLTEDGWRFLSWHGGDD